MNRRILFVIEDAFPLGGNLLLKPLVDSLASRGFELHVVALSAVGQTAGAIADWPVQFHANNSATIASRTIWLHELLRWIEPQFIHAWGSRAHWAAMIAAKGHQRARLIASHFELPPRQRSIRRWASAWLTGNTSTMTAVHPAIANRILNHVWVGRISNPSYGIHPSIDPRIQPSHGTGQPIQILPAAFSAGPFDRSLARQRLLEIAASDEADVGPDMVLIGTVARLEPAYRLKDLVWAIDLLCCVRDDVHLFVFGSGSGEKNLRKFIDTTASRPHIHLIPPGMAQENDLAGLDIYWNAQTESPLQAAMLTAMSLGIPTVSVLAEETAHAVLPLITALATNYGARDEFARWTKYLIEQPDSARQIAAQGRAHVEKLFPAEKMIDCCVKLYQSTR